MKFTLLLELGVTKFDFLRNFLCFHRAPNRCTQLQFVGTDKTVCTHLKMREYIYIYINKYFNPANLKPHEYSDIKVGQPPRSGVEEVFRLYSSVTHFVLHKNSAGRRVHMFRKRLLST